MVASGITVAAMLSSSARIRYVVYGVGSLSPWKFGQLLSRIQGCFLFALRYQRISRCFITVIFTVARSFFRFFFTYYGVSLSYTIFSVR